MAEIILMFAFTSLLIYTLIKKIGRTANLLFCRFLLFIFSEPETIFPNNAERVTQKHCPLNSSFRSPYCYSHNFPPLSTIPHSSLLTHHSPDAFGNELFEKRSRFVCTFLNLCVSKRIVGHSCGKI